MHEPNRNAREAGSSTGARVDQTQFTSSTEESQAQALCVTNVIQQPLSQWARWYAAAGFHPLRLQPATPGEKDTGKRPLVQGWQHAPLNLEALCAELDSGPANLGIRTGLQRDGSAFIGLDVDSEPEFALLAERLSTLPPTFRTETGRGFHLVFRVPPELLQSVRNFTKRQGCDMRAEGGQLVASPSLHYSGKQYALTCATPPAWLPEDWQSWLRTRSVLQPSAVATDEPCPRPRDNRWSQLACTVAAGAEPDCKGSPGRTWKLAVRLVRGLELSNDAALWLLQQYNARSSEPLPPEKLQRAVEQAELTSELPWGFARPLRADLNQAEHPEELEPAAKAGQSDAAAEFQAGATYSAQAALAIMNAKHRVLTAVGASGKARVFRWGPSPLNRQWRVPVLQSHEDFRKGYQPVRVYVEGIEKPVQAADWWLNNAGRAESTSLCFEPLSGSDVNGQYNLWTGYGVEPQAGDWSKMRSFIREVIASGDEQHETYILNWLAWVLQNPGDRAEVVLVLRGKKGTGKNTLLDTLCHLLGQHGKAISSPKHLTGNFNAHLQDCALLFANEAIPPNDKAAEAVLKALVTDPTLAVERKGIDVEMAPNRLSICMASNESWCVPAGLDERRFAVFNVSDAHIKDEHYFRAIRAELNSGGREAMLHDLLARQLSDWHPRRDVPNTAALVEQQLNSLPGAERIVYQMLAAGRNAGALPSVVGGEKGWTFCSTRQLAEQSGKERSDETRLGRELARCCPATKCAAERATWGYNQKRRASGHWLPPLAEARANWSTSTGLNPSWGEAEADWLDDCPD